jgi:hypothetical protein
MQASPDCPPAGGKCPGHTPYPTCFCSQGPGAHLCSFPSPSPSPSPRGRPNGLLRHSLRSLLEGGSLHNQGSCPESCPPLGCGREGRVPFVGTPQGKTQRAPHSISLPLEDEAPVRGGAESTSLSLTHFPLLPQESAHLAMAGWPLY